MARDTRAALLEAARRRFAAHGYAGTSIRDLAGDVGIKESSVYKHFAGKQAVLDAVLAVANDRVIALAEGFGVAADDPDAAAPAYASITLDRLTEIAEGFLGLWLHDSDVVGVRRLLTLEQYRTPEAGRLLRDFVVERPLAFQTPLFAELMRRGAFRPADPEAVALAFWGPVLAILTAAEDPADEPAARSRLRAHLGHFRTTHLAAPGHEEEP